MARAFDRLSGVNSTPRARGKREERKDVVVEDEKQELEEQQNQDVYGDAVNQAAGITQVENTAMKPKVVAPWAKNDGQGNQGNQQTQFAGTVAGQTTGNTEGTVAGNTSANTEGTLAEINQPHIPANGTEPKVEGKKAEVTEQEAPRKGMYEQLWEEQNRRLQMSEEELAKQKRRERAQKAIAAFGDLATAAVNTGFAAKGANTPTETPNLSERYSGMWKDWYNEYKANQDKYVTGRENARKLDYQERKADREYQLKLQRERINEAKLEEQSKTNAIQNELRMAQQAYYNTKNDALKKDIADLEKKLARQENESNARIAKMESDARANLIRANAAANRASNAGSTGGYTFNGKTYKSEAAAYNDIVTEAIRLGISPKKKGKGKDARTLIAEIEEKKRNS